MVVCRCDLCGEMRECVQKEIDQKEYDVCRECWDALEAKLKGKGRAIERRGVVLLPPPEEKKDEREEKPKPGGPPTIWTMPGET